MRWSRRSIGGEIGGEIRGESRGGSRGEPLSVEASRAPWAAAVRHIGHPTKQDPRNAARRAIPPLATADRATYRPFDVGRREDAAPAGARPTFLRRTCDVSRNVRGEARGGLVTPAPAPAPGVPVPAPTAAPAPAVRRELEPTHPCIRCGRPGVPADDGLCELCNPLELSQPSATQMHGIAAVGIIAFIVVLAVAGRAALSGTGPFEGRIGTVAVAPGGLAVAISVTNQGSKATATTCAVAETPARAGGAVQVVQTPLIQPGATVDFLAVVTKFGSTPIALAADCSSP